MTPHIYEPNDRCRHGGVECTVTGVAWRGVPGLGMQLLDLTELGSSRRHRAVYAEDVEPVGMVVRTGIRLIVDNTRSAP